MPSLDQSLALDLSSTDLTARWYGKTRLLLEEPPTRRLFQFRDEVYDIPLPWLYYLVSFKDRYGSGMVSLDGYWLVTQLFGSPKRIADLDDHLCTLPLPNLYSSRPCYYTEDCCQVSAFKGRTHEQAILGALANWWMGGSNFDAFPYQHPIYSHLIKDMPEQGHINRAKAFFRRWEALSIDEMLELPWQPLQSTVRTSTRIKSLDAVTAEVS